MELQPRSSQLAWINPQHAGMVRMWLWHAFAEGDSFACTYRFRHRFMERAISLRHYGPDGVTPRRGFAILASCARNYGCPDKYDPQQSPRELPGAQNAILWNHETLEYRSAETDRSVGHVGTYVSYLDIAIIWCAVEFPTRPGHFTYRCIAQPMN